MSISAGAFGVACGPAAGAGAVCDGAGSAGVCPAGGGAGAAGSADGAAWGVGGAGAAVCASAAAWLNQTTASADVPARAIREARIFIPNRSRFSNSHLISRNTKT
ncbi:hypothetical protein LMTR3_08100 [Bradyrhizobium sp. LMTR 3]|nr:hypothetical protein LMTR3_08100 [Bradyrhizobium sp. LMTR 3]